MKGGGFFTTNQHELLVCSTELQVFELKVATLYYRENT